MLLLTLVLLTLSGCGGPQSGSTTKGGFVRLAASPERFRPPRRKLLLAVGVSDYGEETGWHDLRFAGRDAEEMSTTLDSGGFETVELLSGRVTRSQLADALDRLERQVRDPSDVVLIYVSGHGTLARKPGGRLERFFVTSDSRLADVPGTALSVAELQRRFERLASRRKVLLMATCHSGSGKSQLPEELLAELKTYKSAFFPPPMEGASRAAIVIGASGWGEPAREDAELQHDVYTYYFLEAVRRGYDPDADGGVTVTEAHDYARRLTYQRSGGAQRPYLRSDILGSDPILLAGTPHAAALPLLLSFGPDLSGLQVRIDGQTKGMLPGSVVAEPGERHIELSTQDGRLVAEREVTLRPGERLVLEELLSMPQQAPYSVDVAMGYETFVDSRSRARLAEPLLVPRVAFSRQGLLDGRLRLFGELAATPWQSEHTAAMQTASGATVDVDYRSFAAHAGIGAAFLLRESRRVRLELAPLLTALYFSRSLDIPGQPEDEGYLGMAPALELSLRVQARRPLYARGGLRLSYVAFRVDDAWRHLALAYVHLGAGVDF